MSPSPALGLTTHLFGVRPTVIRALGYSQTDDFKPFKPGRLCRGRERWIAPWDPEEGTEPADLFRLIVTGAAFDDDSARDALRGLTAAGVGVSELIAALLPGKRLVAFIEDGHPADIPDEAFGIELYDGYRAGGRVTMPLVRWYKVIDTAEKLMELSEDLVLERISGFAVVDKKADLEALWEKVFLLVGMSTLDSPPARYNPAAMPEMLELCEAVVILHRDKHGPVLGIYSNAPVEGALEVLEGFAAKAECLLVPFAIPPMLARWDRALFELRSTWDEAHDEPFPVPESEAPSHWEARRHRRRRGKKSDDDSEETDHSPETDDSPATDDSPETDDSPAVDAEPPQVPLDLDTILSGDDAKKKKRTKPVEE